MTKSPTLGEFLDAGRHEFGFLVAEFGFVEQSEPDSRANPFSLCFLSATTVVRVEGIQWGLGLQVLLGRVTQISGAPSCVPLWAIIEVRAPNTERSVAGQLQQLAFYAEMLRLHAADVLRGDFSSFSAAMEVVERCAREAAKPSVRALP